MSNVTVTDLFIYPLKSAAGIALSSMELQQQGPRWDREWMLIESDGTFVSQRTEPKLALLRTQIHLTHLVVSAQNHNSISIPLKREEQSEPAGVTIFNQPVSGSASQAACYHM